MNPLLRTGDLSVTYAGCEHASLTGITLAIGAGEVTGITGPSGSGKSTLALAILGALPADAVVRGSIEYRGKGIAPVFQEPLASLHPMLSVGRQIYEVVRARRGWDRTRSRTEAEAALELVGLNPAKFYGAWPYQLSGGERHRALIAQAIAGQPGLIVADEPTASLDDAAAADMMALFAGLTKQLGLTMIFITHSPRLLAGFADRVLTMRAGRLGC